MIKNYDDDNDHMFIVDPATTTVTAGVSESSATKLVSYFFRFK
jgi:hypothetical protein